MANLPHDPIDTPAELEISAVSTNADVGGISALYPPLERISLEDLVGPEAANRQHAALADLRDKGKHRLKHPSGTPQAKRESGTPCRAAPV